MASRYWKDGTRRGIAYVEGREAAERVMEAAGRRATPPAKAAPSVRVHRRGPATVRRPECPAEAQLAGAMAIYLDKRGKPFAWQIPFDIKRIDAVAAILASVSGSESV